MTIRKRYMREFDAWGRADKIQALTQASTATSITNYGVTTITSAGSGTAGIHGFILDEPTKGVRKSIVVDLNSTRQVAVYNNSTGITFFGSTNNAVTFSTGTGVKAIEMVGVSTASWAITANTTGVTLSASTISG